MDIQHILDHLNEGPLDPNFLDALESDENLRKDLINHFRQQPERAMTLALLKKLVELRRADSNAVSQETLMLASYLLGLSRQVEDCLTIWGAKTTDFDTFCGIDIQLAMFAGVDETIRYLNTQDSAEAQTALTYIHDCNEADDFHNIASYFDSNNLPWYI